MCGRNSAYLAGLWKVLAKSHMQFTWNAGGSQKVHFSSLMANFPGAWAWAVWSPSLANISCQPKYAALLAAQHPTGAGILLTPNAQSAEIKAPHLGSERIEKVLDDSTGKN